jgi:ubiquitin C-terminal hydrolase
MAHVPPLTKHLFEADLAENPCEITKEYQKVVIQLFLKGQTDPVNPRYLLTAFQRRFSAFANQQQHDAQEVILLLIDVFEKSLGKDYITSLFNGEEINETIYPGGRSDSKSQFVTRFLDVTAPCKLNEVLDKRSEPTAIMDYTDETGKTHYVAAIRNRVERWPKIISISFLMYNGKYPVEIPEEFEGRRLFACVLHSGVQQGGHYALLVRRWDKWYLKDDESVQRMPDINRFNNTYYMAFYRPKNSSS